MSWFLPPPGGLGDGLGTVGYIYSLAEALGKASWSFIHLLLFSAYSGFGHGSLEQDAKEIGKIVEYLRNERGKKKIVLMGHSTG